MANTLTSLIPSLYQDLDVVSRELIGFIPAVQRNSSAERVALNETIVIPIVPVVAAADITPGVTAPDTGDQTIGNTTMTITKSRMVPVRWNGEETMGLKNSGMFPSINSQRMQQAFRTLANEVETDLGALASLASRAYGTAGTAGFGTAADLSDIAQPLKILEDNGAPMNDLQFVFGSSTMANIRGKQSVLFKVNEAGTADLLRRGVIGELQGAQLHNSAGIARPAVGTGTSYTSTTAGFAIGVTSIPLITGSGTILAGDLVTFAGDTNKYAVVTGVAAPGTIVLQEPGLRQAIAASAVALTVVARAERNILFPRNAICLVTRAPAMPENGDSADDVVEITDPVSGLAFQIAMYKQYRQIHLEVGLAWGVKMPTPRHVAGLLG